MAKIVKKKPVAKAAAKPAKKAPAKAAAKPAPAKKAAPKTVVKKKVEKAPAKAVAKKPEAKKKVEVKGKPAPAGLDPQLDQPHRQHHRVRRPKAARWFARLRHQRH